MSKPIVQKIINYLRLPYLTAAQRDAYEQIRMAICANPQLLSQIVEKPQALDSYYDAAYFLDADIKLFVAQSMGTKKASIPLSGRNNGLTPYYFAYAAMPNGKFLDLEYTERAKLLFSAAKKTAAIQHNVIDTNEPKGIRKFLADFRKKYNAR